MSELTIELGMQQIHQTKLEIKSCMDDGIHIVKKSLVGQGTWEERW
jgi:formylmethanofuran dehydrogenase subunit E